MHGKRTLWIKICAHKYLIFIICDFFFSILKIGKGDPKTFTYILGVERVWKYKIGSGIGYHINCKYWSDQARRMTLTGRYNQSESRIVIDVILVRSLILVFLATSVLANSFLKWHRKTTLKAKSLRQFSQVKREDNS